VFCILQSRKSVLGSFGGVILSTLREFGDSFCHCLIICTQSFFDTQIITSFKRVSGISIET